ncbi:chloride channel protein [Jeotgalibaca sp. A127]|uniref:chloride channel protein n=1 Tax=Jeotgalibaca sp. A127 TaxID=3457324 RepID=UPI003FD49B52
MEKVCGGILAIGSGLFLGREGPSIQLGAMVGRGVSDISGGDEISDKILISSGAGAGLAAAFNAPVAGLMFVLEEIHHNFSPLIALTTFIATVTANFVSLNVFGLTPALDIGAITSLPVKYYGAVVLLGVLLAVAGWGYSRVLLSVSDWYSKLSFFPSHLYGLIPFLAVIPIGWFLPHLIGGGSGIVLNLEQWHLSLGVLIGLFILLVITDEGLLKSVQEELQRLN